VVALALLGRASLGPHGTSAVQAGATDQSTAHAAHQGSRGPDSAQELFAFPRARAPPAPAWGLWLDTVEYGSLLGEVFSPVAHADEVVSGNVWAPSCDIDTA
jgi:hypothetical protein